VRICPSCKELRKVALWIPHIADMEDMEYDIVCNECCVFYIFVNKMEW
jgi:hypothetical protein